MLNSQMHHWQWYSLNTSSIVHSGELLGYSMRQPTFFSWCLIYYILNYIHLSSYSDLAGWYQFHISGVGSISPRPCLVHVLVSSKSNPGVVSGTCSITSHILLIWAKFVRTEALGALEALLYRRQQRWICREATADNGQADLHCRPNNCGRKVD
jgi:hypothetical protein